MIIYQFLLLVTLCIPLPSNQHFVWPLAWCLLADLCNHTWIPECGKEKSDNTVRLFIDECDMFEYNCDYKKDYELVNYSDCFGAQATCPPVKPCPSRPTCPNHALHRMGQRYVFITEARRMARPPIILTTRKMDLPKHMLHGKRRYTPNVRRCARAQPMPKQTTARRTMPRNKYIKPIKWNPSTISMSNKPQTSRDTIVLKRETVWKNGHMYLKVVKAFAKRRYQKEDSDFLE